MTALPRPARGPRSGHTPVAPRSSERPACKRDHWAIGRPPGHTDTGGQAGERGVWAPPRPHGEGAPRGGAAVSARGALLWPAGGRVLPRLLAPVHGEVHERVAVVHGLGAAAFRPVGFEDAVPVPCVAHEVHHADVAPGEGARRGRRVLSTTACPSP